MMKNARRLFFLYIYCLLIMDTTVAGLALDLRRGVAKDFYMILSDGK
jgi:hypothetical protein